MSIEEITERMTCDDGRSPLIAKHVRATQAGSTITISFDLESRRPDANRCPIWPPQ